MSKIEKSRIVGMTDMDLDEFTCAICHEIFDNPLMTHCCRQTFCRSCIEQWIVEQNTCPNDRRQLRVYDLMPVPRLIINFLNNMRVKCDYYMDGCQVITAFADLPQHLKVCDKRPQIICQTCGYLNDGLKDEHNCLENLCSRVDSLSEEMDRLRDQNKQLGKFNITQSWAIESARNAINEFVIEEPSDRIDFIKQKFFVEICKEVILNNDNLVSISEALYTKINYPVTIRDQPAWHAFVFTSECGESMVRSKNYFRVRFSKIVIELFTAGKLS